MWQVAEAQVPRWVGWFTFVLAVAGLGLSIYLAYEHGSGSVTLACPNTGTLNCEKVTTSSYSVVAGIPVAYAGVVFYLVTAVAMWPAVWRLGAPVPMLRIGLVGVGMISVFYLLWAEFVKLHAICLWCTAVHVITFVLFVTVLLAEALRMPDFDTPVD